MKRRAFLQRAGLSLGAVTTATAATRAGTSPRRETSRPFQPDDWSSVREQFPLSRSSIHMSMFLLASHPRPVAEAIERHRRGLDENPAAYVYGNIRKMDPKTRAAAAEYMGGSPDQIALTDSTTMGLGLVYGSLHLEPHQEAVCTTHCHYSTQMSLQHRAERTGANVRHATLYADPARTSVDEIVTNTRRAITDRTRVFAVTWTHSCTGVKLPIKAMSAVVRDINASRDPKDRVIFCVDGVHAFGIENVRIDELGCDFFIAGTHKWIFGPRGTGVIWARPKAWAEATPIIPSFGRNGEVWRGRLTPDQVVVGDLMTPGGFHSFEHRWAVSEAFRFHLQIGKARVQQRIHELNSMAKAAMAEMPHVTVHTPLSPELSAGIICFEVDGYTPDQVVEEFVRHDIMASKSPYRVSYPRLAPSLINNEDEVERCMRVLRAMA
jgi:selenocysteine lyase/cysteine desulfurase